MKDTIVLAYSGGLDTSVALRWLADEYDADVIALDADPLADIGVLADPDRITGVWARGRRVKGAAGG